MKQLSKLQKIVLIIYLVISGLIYLIFSLKALPRESLNILILFYGFGTAFGLLIAYLRELRNNFNCLIWISIGLIHFAIYNACKNDWYFNMKDYSNQANWVSFADKTSALSTDSLKATIIVILSIRVFDFIFLKLTGKELIGTYHRFSWYSVEDNRRITWLDVVFNILLYLITLTATMIKI